jgi:methylenetetrahydrofolate dehydrogenase (NADP+)/methenyltetrahydrofolate cyclohydrolase
MAEAKVIDGKALAEQVRGEVAKQVAALKASHNIIPGLAVVLVGEDAASMVYVASKGRMAKAVGMHSIEERLPTSASEADVIAVVDRLNADPAVDGILVQLPFPDPKRVSERRVISHIDPDKDVDGLHVVNAGRLLAGEDGIVPATPMGCMTILERFGLELFGGSLAGKHAVVIGRSNLVGKPIGQLLLRASCTVTMAHSKTADLPCLCRSADILVAAVGQPQMVRGDWVKPGAFVIDVGTNRIPTPDGKGRLVGDVNFPEAVTVAGAITPSPGGVGPMTIASLLQNTVKTACLRRGIAVPKA